MAPSFCVLGECLTVHREANPAGLSPAGKERPAGIKQVTGHMTC